MTNAGLVEEVARALSVDLQLDAPHMSEIHAEWEHIAANSRDVCTRAQTLSPSLIFQHPPQSPLERYHHQQADLLPLSWAKSAPITTTPNTGPFALRPADPSTKSFIAVESMLWTLVTEIDSRSASPPSQVVCHIEQAAEILDGLKCQSWTACQQALGEKLIASSKGIPIFCNPCDCEFRIQLRYN